MHVFGLAKILDGLWIGQGGTVRYGMEGTLLDYTLAIVWKTCRIGSHRQRGPGLSIIRAILWLERGWRFLLDGGIFEYEGKGAGRKPRSGLVIYRIKLDETLPISRSALYPFSLLPTSFPEGAKKGSEPSGVRPPLYPQLVPPHRYSSPTLWHEQPRAISPITSAASSPTSRGHDVPPQIYSSPILWQEQPRAWIWGHTSQSSLAGGWGEGGAGRGVQKKRGN